MVRAGRSAGWDLLGEQLDRRRLLKVGTATFGAAALAPLVAACGDDDNGDDAGDDTSDDGVTAAANDDGNTDDELQEAMEQAEEETDVELDALDDDGDGGFPDDFPEDIYRPDDWEIVGDLSSDGGSGREIMISFVSDEDRMSVIETYSAELESHYEIDDEQINEEMETAQWDFHGNDWEWARLSLTSPRPDHDEREFEVTVILRDFVP